MAAEHDRNPQLIIQAQQFASFVPRSYSAESLDLPDNRFYNLRVLTPQLAIDFDKLVINLRIVSDELVCRYQTAEPMPEGCARRSLVCFINKDAAEPAMLFQYGAQSLKH